MREQVINFVTLMGIIGIPSIFTMTIWCIKQCTGFTKQFVILMKAQKAQMRAQLIKDYETFMTNGYVLNIELDEWVNQYNAYHELVGENGVLDDRYKNLLRLPNQPPIQNVN